MLKAFFSKKIERNTPVVKDYREVGCRTTCFEVGVQPVRNGEDFAFAVTRWVLNETVSHPTYFREL